jgi:hypothetical protein
VRTFAQTIGLGFVRPANETTANLTQWWFCR